MVLILYKKGLSKRGLVLGVLNKKEINGFLELQRRGLKLEKRDFDFSDINWEIIMTLSIINKSCILVNNVVNDSSSDYNIPESVLNSWNNRSKLEFMKSARQVNRYKQIALALRDNGIKGIVIKGYALATLYPDLFQRYSGDLDIKFDKADKGKVKKVFTDLGLVQNEEDSKENVYIFYDNTICIEAHFTLWEDYEGQNIDILRQEKLDDEDTIIPLYISGTTEESFGYTLGITEHLILQMFHVIKHFILEGIEDRYMMDLSLYINRYYDQIDFIRFWDVMKRMEFEDYTVIYFSECIKYFELDNRALCGREYHLARDEEAFLGDMLMVGKRSFDDESNFSMLGILSPYVNGGKKLAVNKTGRILDTLFPSAKDIDAHYSYCKKFKILLPLAWIHRVFRTIYFKATKGNRVYGAVDKIKGAEYRISMMKNAGMLKDK